MVVGFRLNVPRTVCSTSPRTNSTLLCAGSSWNCISCPRAVIGAKSASISHISQRCRIFFMNLSGGQHLPAETSNGAGAKLQKRQFADVYREHPFKQGRLGFKGSQSAVADRRALIH